MGGQREGGREITTCNEMHSEGKMLDFICETQLIEALSLENAIKSLEMLKQAQIKR